MTPQIAVALLQEDAATVRNPALKAILQSALQTRAYLLGYGASVETDHKHHAYPGGLGVHTAEVVLNANVLAAGGRWNKKPDFEILIPAAILHDFGKWLDYNQQGKKLPQAKLIYHVASSYAWFERQAKQLGLDFNLTQQISHCILSHHGRKEWGSPIEPQTVEAQILHFADYLSMSYGEGR